MIPITTLCIVVCSRTGPDIAGKTEFVTGKKFKRESLVYHNKTKSLKNVSMWYQKKPIPQLRIFCLIQGINNYVQINKYWRYIVRIMASNILLLVSKNNVLTCQGLVGAGMNSRALSNTTLKHFSCFRFLVLL
jgi:hypothetical protein